MNKEELIRAKTQIKNKWFETKEEELDMSLNIIDDLLLKNKQLKDNWNKLKNCMIYIFNRTQKTYYLDLLETMQELEKGENDE